MTENVPPGSASKAATKDDAGPRGLPYYEKLRRDLRDTLNRKRNLDRNLAQIEANLHASETAYLEETSTAGNIIKGFDNYIKSSTISAVSTGGGGTISGAAAGGGLGARRKAPVNETDRVFSRSSLSAMRESDTPTSATSTPIHAGTPTGSFSAAPDKDKKKKKANLNVAEDSEVDSKNKRQKFSFNSGRGHND